MDIKRTQKLMLISNLLKKLQQISCEKVINEKVTEKLSFFYFYYCVQKLSA
jgi:hypothetical protein